jgi:type I restriction enzyme S subunit
MEKLKYPEIRFGGFGGDWLQSNLAECTDLLTGNPFNSKEFTSNGIFLVRGMNVKRGYLDTSTNLSEYWPSSKGLEHYLLEPEDIVIQMDGALIGKSYAKINSKNLPALLVQRVTRVRSNNVEIELIYQYIQKDFLSHISGIKTETAVPHLSLHDIRNFTVFLPEKQEQTAIGNFFQQLDQSIVLQQQKYTQTQNLKKAMLEKMFPKAGSKQPEIRIKGFGGDWEKKTIGDILKIKSGMSQKEIEIEKGMYPILATGGIIGRTNTPIYKQESVLIGRKGTIDKPYYMNTPFWTVDTLFYSEIFEANFALFVYALFQKIEWRNYNTSTGVPSLTSSTIHRIGIKTPKFEEQTAIGQFFKQLDDTLALQQQQLQTLKNLKHAFLGKMFV